MSGEEPALLKLFVYGTLKSGERNHERFCRGALEIERATVRGRLYDLPYGFPALVVPEEDVRAVGTADPSADAALSGGTCTQRAIAGWGTVRGELLTFDDPEVRLPKIDALEGFRPGGEGLYARVLVPVALPKGRGSVLAWTYSMEGPPGVHLPGGVWPP